MPPTTLNSEEPAFACSTETTSSFGDEAVVPSTLTIPPPVCVPLS